MIEPPHYKRSRVGRELRIKFNGVKNSKGDGVPYIVTIYITIYH